MKINKHNNVAIVYDWLDKWGGVERVLQVFHEMFPQATFYTSYYDRSGAAWADSLTIKTSFIQSLPSFVKKSRVLSLGLYPYAFESFDFSSYDTVISVTSSFAKGIITRPETKHICYLLTPTRFLWLYPEEYLGTGVKKIIGEITANRFRTWDYIAAQRPDHIISLSQTVAERCNTYYHRESEVIYPPFDIDYWNSIKPVSHVVDKPYYLVVSRLEPYKKVEIVIEAFNKTKEQLIIVGKGSQKHKLKSRSASNIKFVEDISDEELAGYYQKAKAVIMMQEEDFGYVSLEAQFFGCPVITYVKGGVWETILPDKTGFGVKQQTQEALIDTLEIFHTISYNNRIPLENVFKKQVIRFAKQHFVDSIRTIINNY